MFVMGPGLRQDDCCSSHFHRRSRVPLLPPASAMMSREPIALQLRFLQTMREISSEHNTTTFLPVPIDLFAPLIKKGDPPKKRLNYLPPPLNQGLGLIPKSNQEDEDEEDSITKSPTLAKFAIARHDAPPDSILPALQPKSPQRASLAGPQHRKQTLPGLQTAIGNYKDPSFAMFAAMSPSEPAAPPPRRWRNLLPRTRVAVLLLILVLVGVRLALPFAIESYVIEPMF